MKTTFFTPATKALMAIVCTLYTLSSCAIYKSQYHTYSELNVKLDAYSNNQNALNKVALLVCNDVNIPSNDLRNLEFESYIKRALVQKGYTFTDNERDADVVVFYEYGVSDPRIYTSDRIEPIWGVTGIQSSVVASTRQRNPNTGRSFSAQVTYNTPNYGQIGERVVTDVTTKYLCWANISAYDADHYKRTGEDKMLWRTEIQSENLSDNLRAIFPFMIAAAREHIGQNRNRVNVNIATNPIDPRILELVGSLVVVHLQETATGKNNPIAAVYQDVYRNGELIIRAGTPVKMAQKRDKVKVWDVDPSLSYQQRAPTLEFSNFSTTSVFGSAVSLKGTYLFIGSYEWSLAALGALFLFIPPLGISLLCNSTKHPYVPVGTLLYLEIE